MAAATACAPFAVMADESDFGIQVEKLLKEQSTKLFGVETPLEVSALPTVGPYRTALQAADDQILAATGLKVEFLTREAANATDMMAFYPAQNPTHLVTCVEGGRQFLIDGGTPNAYDAGDKLNPSVQRINLNTGAVETILRGMSSCDGIRTTSWGTVLATEERTDGGAYEIFNPLGISEQAVIDRASGRGRPGLAVNAGRRGERKGRRARSGVVRVRIDTRLGGRRILRLGADHRGAERHTRENGPEP
jgi:hypothetical protein